ncbi:MAG: non-heme iron oxygenase ferredoxin subunit [Propionicimonas sp.]|uniref:Rieske (2Fe-2S) protein n=1 Tax=Propionicimonas sp. TaxID=1955623 RepID=UPI002B20EE57|nr:non-heme iron oxygenase ferredoxin subunit [Propionicimonas sp.]MEA4942957.1 non-heme iron oxygenase ferredoxin subunit [Propionicimonas sp.]MEA5051984.1 non-heme iron oxygenase ferredoxin subunit [Propionicimonas sp.]MEA5116116.1 non-heme iron oxygenase ferredoxin subunit [Propionicimonas sp.]
MTFVRACALAEVPVGTAAPVVLGDTEIAVVNTDGGVYAILDCCSHGEVPLSEGEVEGSTIECYMHGSRFDLRTGNPLELPAVVPVPVYPVRVDAGDILIDPDNPIQTQEQ